MNDQIHPIDGPLYSRPAKPLAERRDFDVQTWLNETEFRALNGAAGELGIDRSSFIRMVLLQNSFVRARLHLIRDEQPIEAGYQGR